jgi:RNA polymerase sigma-70 factor (ECF subfamily)
MLRQARNYVRSTASAEDVVQETWLAVLKGLDRFRGDASLRGWTFRILTNIARKQGGKDARALPVGLAMDPPAYEPGAFRGVEDSWPGHWRSGAAPQAWEPEQQALSRESREVLAAALAKLPGRQREVVELRDVHGFSSQEVCEALSITPANQRVLLHRGRSQVRATLDGLMTVAT